MGVISRKPHSFDMHRTTLYETIGEQIGLAISNARLHKSIQTLTITDELTGAFNRRYLDTRLDRLG